MLEKEKIEIENKVLDHVAGKLFLLQDRGLKVEAILEALQAVLDLPAYKQFKGGDSSFSLDTLANSILSYGVIDEFLSDPTVEDIMIDFLSPISLHTTKDGLVKTDKSFHSRDELELFIKKLIVFSGRKAVKKINNIELAAIKGRANIVYSPFGPQITITRAKEKPLSIIELIEGGALTPQMAAQLWLYVEGMGIKPANIIIAGGPAAGKTTLLNAMLSFMPPSERIVVIEDTLELNTDLLENYSRLASDEDMSLESLVKNALRMRPDRIIVGEVRGSEAKDLMTAMQIGKYCMGTLHASTSREITMRLTNEPMHVPELLVGLIDAFVIMRRHKVNNKIKRVVGEISESAGMESGKTLLSTLWNYSFSAGRFQEAAVSGVYSDRLAEIVGKTPKDILDEIQLRTSVIEMLVKKNIKDFLAVTEIARRYCDDPAAVLKELGIEKIQPVIPSP